jgi:hypothetical protein
MLGRLAVVVPAAAVAVPAVAGPAVAGTAVRLMGCRARLLCHRSAFLPPRTGDIDW